MSKKFRFLSCLTAVFALALMAVSPVAFAGPEKNDKAGEKSSEKGNDRKSGYEGNSSTPQETNHGKNSDHDGDADADSNTAYTEDNDTNDGGTPNNVSDDGDNRHPSGKDRSVENGKSGNQGKSESNPDDSKGPMRYEGAQGDDKPNGPGGTDLADQDGNNGCGNDDDFDDDNNGWCGKPQREDDNDDVGGEVIERCPDGSEMPANGKCDEVDGDVTELCPDGSEMPASGDVEDCEVEVDENPGNPDDDVLGERIDRDEQPSAPTVLGVRLSPALNEPVEVAGAVLPFTGGDALIFLAAAMALIGAGTLALRFRSNES